MSARRTGARSWPGGPWWSCTRSITARRTAPPPPGAFLRCARRSRASGPMRPRELTLRGFRSYADETTFDFGDRSLVGIVGPIGSGKSSILDAVAFALYGKTPRIASDTKSLINQRRDALGDAVKARIDRLGGRLQILAERRASAEADRVVLVSRQVELIAAEERAATLAALRLSVNQAQDVIREAEGRLKAAAAEAAILDSLADQVPTQEATAGLFAEADAATAVMAEAEAAAIRAEASAVRAAEAWEGALAAVGGRSALERAADVVASVRGALTDRDRERARLDEVESLLTAAESDVADAAEAVRLAEQEARRGGEAGV